MTLNSDKNLISLKEAAKISGYSADYIGQLIRAGKIPGRQVYSNIAWMTMAQAVMEYKGKGKSENSRESLGDKIKNSGQKIAMEMNILKLFFQTFRHALPILIIIIISFLLLSGFVVYNFFNYKNVDSSAVPTATEDKSLTF
ncbi:MAG: hypothetical protein V1867_07780 [Candidatus Falkowbacteria bacterium]